jgi:hypothetical protein
MPIVSPLPHLLSLPPLPSPGGKRSVTLYVTLSEAKGLQDYSVAEFTLSCMRFFATLRTTGGEELPWNDIGGTVTPGGLALLILAAWRRAQSKGNIDSRDKHSL